MAGDMAPWPERCRAAAALLARAAALLKLEPTPAEQLDAIQDAARRLALHHAAEAGRVLEPAAGPMDPMSQPDH
jgi:hypothetical protein